MDESGYTGPDLVNREQPVLVLGSTILSDAEAADLARRCFPDQDGRELKHSRLSRTKKWRAQVVDFVRQVPKDKVGFFTVHKEFTLLAFLLDFWLEPMMYRDGVNFYERGMNIALTNVSYITLLAVLGADETRELLRRYQVMTRDRTEFAYESFWDTLGSACKRHELIDKALGTLMIAEAALGPSHLADLPVDMLDLGEYGVLDSIVYWRGQRPDVRFDVIHDESKKMRRNHQTWEALINPEAPKAVVGQDRRTIEFPLPVDRVRLADSSQHVGLQVADVVAGAACALNTARAQHRKSDYTEALAEAGLDEAIAGGVWPSDRIDPKDLETEGPALPDSADFIGKMVKKFMDRQAT